MPLKLDFASSRLSPEALSKTPMTFCDLEAKQALSAIIDLIIIETGDPAARRAWQRNQLANVLKFASERSAFWRKRIGARRIKDVELSALPVLRRDEVREQVLSEGSLVRQQDTLRASKHMSSGSTGSPVEFFVTDMNTRYNQVRMLTQYLMEGRDLSRNRTRIRLFKYEEVKAAGVDPRKGFTVTTTNDWLNSLGRLFASGRNKTINYWHPNHAALLEELSKHDIGYLISLPSLVESLLSGGVDFLKANGTEIFMPLGEGISDELRLQFGAAGIPIRSSYSSEELGGMGAECAAMPGYYHAAHSNVIIEADKANATRVGERELTPVLVTGLHAYATPFVRYDVGDLAVIEEGCPCGHVGVTLSHIAGRSKIIIKHPDGRLSPFNMRASDVTKIAPVREYRVRQVSLSKIILELGGCGDLEEEQKNRLKALIAALAGGNFTVELSIADAIDWGKNQKRLGFVNEVI